MIARRDKNHISFLDLVHLILEILQYFNNVYIITQAQYNEFLKTFKHIQHELSWDSKSHWGI